MDFYKTYYRILLLPLVVATGVLTGFVIPQPARGDNESPQYRAEDNVEAYVKKKFGDAVYKAYNFGQVYRLKATEQRQLDELKELRALVPGMKDNYGDKTDSVLAYYDALIAKKQREITQKNIVSSYIINHVFTVKHKDGSGTVYDGEFILTDQFQVKDFRMNLAADLREDDFDWFYYFFQKYPIFNSGDYDKDISLSNDLYDYYNARLSKLKTGKEEFLLTALRVTRIINKTKKFDKNIIGGYVVYQKLEDMRYCSNYKPVKFMPSEEIMAQTPTGDSLIGYRLFHKFECTNNDGVTTVKAIYAELDPYFVPAGILDVEPPIDKYFEKQK